tara:strand:- start:1021 stop:1278 length:258 start_codon:yes stop_codon:yes gene_type:complete
MVHQFEASLTLYHLKNLFGFLYRLFNFILLLRIPLNSTYIKLSYRFLVVAELELFLCLVALVAKLFVVILIKIFDTTMPFLQHLN